jgi:hypothetical protein
VRLTVEQQEAIHLFNLAPTESLFSASEAINLLDRHSPLVVAASIKARLRLLIPTKYQRRWARRLREQFSFGREDAHIVALATFGMDEQNTIFGTDVLVTYDLRLIERYDEHFNEIQLKLRRMTCQLNLPYKNAILPEISTPKDVLSLFSYP